MTNQELIRAVRRLRVEPGQKHPRKIPRKLKKAWKRQCLRTARCFELDLEFNLRYRVRWVPYQGWTMTTHPSHRIAKQMRTRKSPRHD